MRVMSFLAQIKTMERKMYFQKSKKGFAAILSAVMMGSAVCGSIMNPYEMIAVSYIENSNTTVSAEISDSEKAENNESVVMWKAQLTEYSNRLSLVGYETVEYEEEEVVEEEEIIIENDEFYDDTSYIEYGGDGIYDVPGRVEHEAVSVAEGDFGFTTYGYGHGVGLSQNGANHYAHYSGWSYEQILQHYYPGTYIMNSGKANSETISAGGVSGSVLDVVSMVVYSEVGSSMHVEAIKAQAVAAYTYIKYKGGNASDLYTKSNPPQNVVNAVKSVLGEAVCYDGGYALTMFCASSGGSTASCYDVFYEDIPYLRSVYCDYDSEYDPHYGTTVAFSADEVRYTLESNLGITLSDDPSNWVTIVEGDGGYASSVIIDGQVTIKGNDFRYYFGLKSPKFTCTYY